MRKKYYIGRSKQPAECAVTEKEKSVNICQMIRQNCIWMNATWARSPSRWSPPAPRTPRAARWGPPGTPWARPPCSCCTTWWPATTTDSSEPEIYSNNISTFVLLHNHQYLISICRYLYIWIFWCLTFLILDLLESDDSVEYPVSCLTPVSGDTYSTISSICYEAFRYLFGF